MKWTILLAKVAEYLDVSEKRTLATKRINDRRAIMEEALKNFKDKWEEMVLVPAGEFQWEAAKRILFRKRCHNTQ
jgi:galactokinase